MSSKLSKEDKIKLLDYLIEYEKHLKTARFDINDSALKSFCDDDNIFLGKLHNTNRKNVGGYSSYILSNFCKKDHALDILTHIRNSVAHGLIGKAKGSFEIKDLNKAGNESMIGKVKIKSFYSLLEQIKATKNNI